MTTTAALLALASIMAAALGAIENTPENWALGAALVANLIQAIRAKNTRAALETVIDGVEIAATRETNAKRAVQMAGGSAAARAIIDSVLVSKGYRRPAAKKR